MNPLAVSNEQSSIFNYVKPVKSSSAMSIEDCKEANQIVKEKTPSSTKKAPLSAIATKKNLSLLPGHPVTIISPTSKNMKFKLKFKILRERFNISCFLLLLLFGFPTRPPKLL